MKRKTLNSDERVLLIRCIEGHNPKLLQKLDQLDSGLLDTDTINEIRVAITEEFVRKGLKKDEEPNEYGLKLEALNEKIAALYLWP